MSTSAPAERQSKTSSTAAPVRSLPPTRRPGFAPSSANPSPPSILPGPAAGCNLASVAIGPITAGTRSGSFGGACHARPMQVQAKLIVGRPDDEYEREADRVAEQGMSMPESSGNMRLPCRGGEGKEPARFTPPAAQTAPRIQRLIQPAEEEAEEEEKEEEGMFQAKGRNPQTPAVDGALHDRIRDLRGGGQPLDPAARAFAESRLGHDFGQVRVHTDARAADSAKSLNALAYTIGGDIVFGAGQYAPSTRAGNRLLLHELTHVIQQNGAKPAGAPPERDSLGRSATSGLTISRVSRPRLQRKASQQSLRDRICYKPGKAPVNRKSTDCDAREPENCPTYELWLNTFTRLRTSFARDTAPNVKQLSPSTMLGERALFPDNPAMFPSAVTPGPPPPAIRPVIADRFIDHPTDTWVKTCLPHNLRETAYRLPSDCADIAVILRHVWLSAHHRTQRFSRWTIGDRAGRARRSRIDWVTGGVTSKNVHRMLNAYSYPDGRPIRSFARLEKLLHPGDVLVWEHHEGGIGTKRTGGHTQTITSIKRNGGRITRIDVVAGDQPIDKEEAKQIRYFLKERNLEKRRSRSRPTPVPSMSALRYAGGRRIDVDALYNTKVTIEKKIKEIKNLQDHKYFKIWTLADGHTTLVAAGPSASVHRPARRYIGGKRIRRISDWSRRLKYANLTTLLPNLEAALLELRSMIEDGQTVTDQEAAKLGQIAGKRLWQLARRAVKSRKAGLAEETHFRPLRGIHAVINALLQTTLKRTQAFSSDPTPAAAKVRRALTLVNNSLDLAARGATTIAFGRRIRRGKTLIKTLVTGFDPFAKPGQFVPPGVVNPSGEAALAMDNTKVKAGKGVAAVEGIVLPVDSDYFRRGMVEDIIRPFVQKPELDAVLTVGLDESIAPTDPVRIERYVVGVRKGDKGLEPIFATGFGLGPAVIENPTPVEQIATETKRPASRRTPAIPKPTVGTKVTFRFPGPAMANQAMKALGLPPVSGREATIGNATALRQITRTMYRSPNGIDIAFQAGGDTYHAAVVEGPGGNYLCNELSYRVLRLLKHWNRLNIPTFLVHAQRPLEQPGARIPQDVSTRKARRARKKAIQSAIRVRNRLIDTLRNMIRAIVRRIMARRKSSGAPTPIR